VRGRRRNKVLAAALVGSALLHLSAVTVFRIVIYFPREYVEYVNFEIVQAATSGEAASQGEPAMAWPPRLDNLAPERMLPPIELPTLEFAELQRLRVRQEGLLPDALRDDIFGEDDTDSWQRFGHSLGQIRRTLTGLTLSGTGAPALPELDANVDSPTLRPAEGFEAYIEWDTAPANRQLLFAPPIRALWELDEAQVKLPLSLVIEVSPMGRVVNVWSPTFDTSGVIDHIQLGVLKYRFEPIEAPDAGNQLGNLQISRAEGGP
jgi:hypothetical protein